MERQARFVDAGHGKDRLGKLWQASPGHVGQVPARTGVAVGARLVESRFSWAWTVGAGRFRQG